MGDKFKKERVLRICANKLYNILKTEVPRLPRSNILNISKIKYFFLLLTQSVFLAILAVDEVVLCRIVTDLLLKKLSYNEIREHLQLIYGLDVTKHKLKKIRDAAGMRAKAVNHELERDIRTKIITVETDEIFQGKNHAILGVAEKQSQFLIGLQPAPDRTAASITAFLAPIAKKYCNIRVVISDLYTAYKSVIPELFYKARHLACHIHAQRISMRYIDKLKVSFGRTKNYLKNIKMTLEKTRLKITKLVLQKADWERKLEKDRAERQILMTLKRQSKSGRSKTIDKKLLKLRKRIKRRSNSLHATIKALSKARKKRDQKKTELSHIEKKLKKDHQTYLQSCRLEKDFIRLLKDKSKKFEFHLQKFILRLTSSKYAYASSLQKMIKNNPHIFSLRKARDLPWNYQNSNTIERIFGILRPRLDSSRLLQTVEGTTYFCDLFRLYYNITPRYTGIHNNQSPFEQLGGKLRNCNYLELLFPDRKRTTLFLGQKISVTTSLGFQVRSYPHRGAIICT